MVSIALILILLAIIMFVPILRKQAIYTFDTLLIWFIIPTLTALFFGGVL
jgi:hypothetical protein